MLLSSVAISSLALLTDLGLARLSLKMPPPTAVHHLCQDSEPRLRTALLSAVALTRQQEVADWLLDLIAKEYPHAADAHEALCRSAQSERDVRLFSAFPRSI